MRRRLTAVFSVAVVVVVRTRPRAIPLAMITMRKSTHGFEYGAPLGDLRICFCFGIDKPDNVKLTANDSNTCQSDIISITCSADGKPSVHTYQLFEDDIQVPDSDTAGEWKRTMSAQGNFTYRCVASNALGTSDKNVTVTVKGN